MPCDALVQGQDSAFVWCNVAPKFKNTTSLLLVLVLLSPCVVDMLQGASKYAVDAKRWLDHARREGVDTLFLHFSLEGEVFWFELEGLLINGHLLWPVLHVRLQASHFFLRQSFNIILDHLAFLLERLHDCNARRLCYANHLLLHRFLQRLLVRQVTACSPGMRIEVEACTIRQAHALEPSIRAAYLGIPTITCIVRHLCGQVLPKSNKFFLATDRYQEQKCPTDEVTKGLIVDDALGNSIAHCHFHRLLSSQLLLLWEE
mmetsp:Transcript_51341/g.94877  ORF Transcript_51341/g.94877 Transcript_51341/m.94877 type:complete len:260 (-) Transcript_51341:990-1769(-)